ncbi:ABC transporter ATP-binding protein [Deinococcus pimensis]|uniref:ABC transporter ATP-binding protein n=1 Tax=Deinococcus pimensis TaxID=309888 RepID=UPI000481FA90|nr:ABC transporter ATP-binding protein [Deinococcus pimensis]
MAAPHDAAQDHLERTFRGERPLSTLRSLYRGQTAQLTLALVFFVVKGSPYYLLPVVTARIIDVVQQRRPLEELWLYALGMGLLIVQNVPTHYLYVRALSVTTRTTEARLRFALCRRLQMISLGFYARNSPAALQAKVLRDVENVEQLTRLLFDAGLGALLGILVAIVTTLLRAPQFALFFLVTVPIAVGLVRVMQGALDDRNAAFRRELEEMTARVGELTHLLPVTRAHGLEDRALGRVGGSVTRVQQAGLRLDGTNAVFGALAWVTLGVFNLACLVAAAWAYRTQVLPITVGDVVLLTTFFSSLTGAVMTLVNIVPQVSKGLESIRSIGEVLQSREVERNDGKRHVRRVRGELVFEDVTYTYPDAARPALERVSFTARPGMTVALVGASGSGKSTLVNVAVGFVRPDEGRVLLDGVDLATLDLRSYRQFVSVVPQEPLLFDGSVRENVTYGFDDVTDDEVERILRDAHAWEFVETMPHGMHTRIGERGAQLSGGQKQRLAIARALIRDPQVLILDEATSALDAHSETLVQQAFERLRRSRTTFVVAHRLGTIRNADLILVFDRGRVVEAGTHQELIARPGPFADLARRQHLN